MKRPFATRSARRARIACRSGMPHFRWCLFNILIPLFFCCVAFGCRRSVVGSDRVTIGAIEIENTARRALPSLSWPSDGQLRAWVGRALQRDQHLALHQGERDASDRQLRVLIGAVDAVQRSASGRGSIALLIEVRAPLGRGLDRVMLRGRVALRLSTTANNELATRLRGALAEAIGDLSFSAGLITGKPEDICAALKAPDIHRVLMAAETAAIRRSRRCLPQLVALLRHADERVADAAIGALMAIGDRSAVRPLTHHASMEDTERLAKLIDAIGELGGPEAERYLEFLAGGHPDEDIRSLAQQALDRCRRGTGSSPVDQAKP